MKKMILIFTYILTLAMLPLRTVCAQDIWETYENGDGTLIITGYHGAGGDIIIPSEIDGKTVSSVDQNVLSAISETATSFSAEPGSPIYTAENGVLYSSPYTEAPEQKFVAAYPKASDAEEFYVPDYVWQFETGACSNADSLRKVSLPQGIDAVNTDAFAGCDNLVELEFRGEYSLPHGTYIDDEGYYHDKDGSYISGGLLIGDGAFSGCTALKSVILPQGTSMILENAFSGCSSLEAVLIPESVSYFTDSPLSAAIFDGSPLAVVYCLPDSPAQEYCELTGVPFRAVASYEEGVSLINDISSAPADAVSEKPSDWAVTEVNAARSNGLIPQELDSGYTLPITRREFCLLVGAYADKMGLNGTSTATFSDTNAPEILKAASLGVINGYPDGSFSPDSSILRSEAAAMLSRTVSLTGNTPNAPYSAFDDEHLFGWAKDNISFISSCIDTKNVTAIMGGVGSNLFDPNGNYTREQAILTFQRLYRYCTGVIQPLYDGNIPVELNGGAKVTFDGKLLKFSDLDAENYHIVVHSGMRFYDYDNTVKSDTITVSGSEFVYDISDLNSGRYIAVIRPVTLNTYAYAQIPEPPLDGSIFSAAPTIAEPPYVYIIKDNDHGYFMPYPAYEYNKKMFYETRII